MSAPDIKLLVWVGSSLKDAGKKAFHAIEITDAKIEVVKALEAKWDTGTPYP